MAPADRAGGRRASDDGLGLSEGGAEGGREGERIFPAVNVIRLLALTVGALTERASDIGFQLPSIGSTIIETMHVKNTYSTFVQGKRCHR